MLQDIEQLHSIIGEIVKKVGLPAPPTLQTSLLKQSDSPPPHVSSFADRPPSHIPAAAAAALDNDNNYGPSCDNSPKISPDDGDLPHVPIHSLYALTKMRALRSPDDADNNHTTSNDTNPATTSSHQKATSIPSHQPPRNKPPSSASDSINDFITRGDIPLDDADRLFHLYRDRLDAFMYNIGCRHRTLSDLRRRSPILTAATLTVAALHDPRADALYGVCSAELRRLTERSMFDRRGVDRDYLRAMCVAAYWLSDMSWLLSGYAIRRAAEVNLHNSFRRAIDESSEEAADGARLWYILNICDGHLATLYGRPSILQGDPSMQEWQEFLDAPISGGEEDRRLLSQIALLGILGSIRALFGPDRSLPVPRAYLHQISHFAKQLDFWIKQWTSTIPEQHPNIGIFPRKGALLHFYFAKLHLYSHIFRGLSKETDAVSDAAAPIPHYFLDAATEAVGVATKTIDFILADPDIGAGFVGMPSYLHCMTAFACMFLIKVAVKYGDDLVDPGRVWQMTTSLLHQFRSLPTGRWHLAKLMAPGLEGMAAMLAPGGGMGEAAANQVAGGDMTDPMLMTGGVNGQMMAGNGGELFFDYGMSFGLSPVFQFDPTAATFMGSAGDPGSTGQEFGVDYGQLSRPDT